MRLADHPAVVGLLRAAGMTPRTRGRDGRAAFARQLRSNRTRYLGAFDRTRLVGVVLGTHDTRKGWINRLAVHPGYRRRGVATRLVRECERTLRKAGIEMFAALIEGDNAASEALFRKLGYDTGRLIYARKKLRPDV
ncbi:MAG: GNAT family N-acetyltransferase [Euryarchaeota archaeon]|nr:GNAT family N-acetyltransferase [Euryarchaeota archaeon]